MEYLDKVLGVKVTYDDVEFKHLPNFIATRYRLRGRRDVEIQSQKIVCAKCRRRTFVGIGIERRCR